MTRPDPQLNGCRAHQTEDEDDDIVERPDNRISANNFDPLSEVAVAVTLIRILVLLLASSSLVVWLAGM